MGDHVESPLKQIEAAVKVRYGVCQAHLLLFGIASFAISWRDDY
jgi:hypothetical protein